MLAGMVNLKDFQAWLGRSEQRTDLVTKAPLAALSATLDRADAEPLPGSDVPPLWHWLYFTPLALQSEIGADGHALRGGFLPPVPLPRRMWAGGRISFEHALQVGDEITRVSRIASVDVKQGQKVSALACTASHPS